MELKSKPKFTTNRNVLTARRFRQSNPHYNAWMCHKRRAKKKGEIPMNFEEFLDSKGMTIKDYKEIKKQLSFELAIKPQDTFRNQPPGRFIKIHLSLNINPVTHEGLLDKIKEKHGTASRSNIKTYMEELICSTILQ
jgi:hypothetical protein